MDQLRRTSHLFCVFFFIYMLRVIVPGSNLFSWHPFLMCSAFGCMMFQAIKSLSKDSALLIKKKANRVRLHWMIQASVMVCAVIGFIVVFYGKFANGRSHFVTWHAQIGLVTLILTAMNGIGGVIALYPKIPKVIGLKPFEMKLIHACAAFVTFVFVSISLITGMRSTYFLLLQKNAGIWYEVVLAIPAILSAEVFMQVYFSYFSPNRRRT